MNIQESRQFTQLWEYLVRSITPDLAEVETRVTAFGRECAEAKKVVGFEELATWLESAIWKGRTEVTEIREMVRNFGESCAGPENVAREFLKEHNLVHDETELKFEVEMILLLGKNKETAKAIKILQEAKNASWLRGYRDAD